MAESQTRYAGTATGNGGTGNSWSNPTNATTDDGNFASASFSLAGQTRELYLRNYGFTLPAGATIVGIEANVRREASGNNCRDLQVQLVDDDVLYFGDDKADTATDWPTSFAIRTYGADNDTWNTSATPAIVNDTDFGIVLRGESLTSSRTLRVDYISLTVHYEAVPDTPTGVTFTAIDHESATADNYSVANATSYDLQWDTDDLFGSPTTLINVGAPPQVISGLPAGETVYARVRACNASGCSAYSTADSTTLDPPQADITQRVTARQSVEFNQIDEPAVSIGQRVTARQSVEATPTMVGSISGLVTLAGDRIEGAVVMIKHPPESDTDFETTTTNASGEYSFDNLLVVTEGYHVAVEWRDGSGNLYQAASLPYLTPEA